MPYIMAQRYLREYEDTRLRKISIFLGSESICNDYTDQRTSIPFWCGILRMRLCNATIDLLRRSNIKESCYIRPLTFVGLHGIDLNITNDSPTHVVIIVFPFAKYFNSEGINTCISSWRRIHDTSTPPMSKAAGNYLNSILATQESKNNGYDESILLDREGNVSEVAGENIFLIRNNIIYTPHIGSSALEGITRDTTITIAKGLGYEVIERPIPRTELYFADELFLTGTGAEITAILSVDRHVIGRRR